MKAHREGLSALHSRRVVVNCLDVLDKAWALCSGDKKYVSGFPTSEDLKADAEGKDINMAANAFFQREMGKSL